MDLKVTDHSAIYCPECFQHVGNLRDKIKSRFKSKNVKPLSGNNLASVPISSNNIN